jgi:hypothetical protein
MYAHSKHSSLKLKAVIPVAILAASLTACVKDSGVLEAGAMRANAVVVGQAAPPAALPDIPKEVDTCMSRQIERDAKKAKNADGALGLAFKSDKAKSECWKIHRKWYAELQTARAPVAEGQKPEPEKKPVKAGPPPATWE